MRGSFTWFKQSGRRRQFANALCLPAFCALLGVALPSMAADPGAAVGPAVYAALERQPQARVLIVFRAADAGITGKDQARSVIAATRSRLLEALPAHSMTLRREFLYVPAIAAEVTPAGLEALAANPAVVRVDLDEGGTAGMAEAAPLANVDEAFALGLNGAGAKVAIIDTGIDTDHADFAGRILAQQCFCSGVSGTTGCCPNLRDTQSGPGSAEDGNGHGTNVSGIAAGGGAVALRGAAPAADIVAVRVLDNQGVFCCSSDVVAGLDWVLANHPDTDVVNTSLGTSQLFAGACDNATSFTMAFATAINNLTANGTLVFASSGNQASPTQMSAPACVANAVSVGAVWDAPRGSTTFLGCTDRVITADRPTCFTNSNANTDLFAPGAFTVSSGRGGGTSSFGGTSQASPLSAGCAAAIRAAAPTLTPAQIEQALEASPTRVTDPKNARNYPRLDCADAAAIVLGFEAVSDR